ncbi:ankyrin repeat domain-containing protein [Endozoicomonas sp. SCSIO W0465]|uniref:ankyrin repeat domain-containing protein n=1 Tax=Endozoicomonas sp. SCSIO W0465 TaxID=2918516 RepID=UPI002075D11B|nr:ankyrin repeat domain-containing protein [Endozoicomonas sp. SCSIO W0465]USE37986.1 ankyrin repeat domain-containing protein [Endozoicomonas sp. SCSIO W0465]
MDEQVNNMSNPLLPNVASSLTPNYPPTETPAASGHALPETEHYGVQSLPDKVPYLHRQKQSLPGDPTSITARQVSRSRSEAPAPIELWKAVKSQDIVKINTLIKTHKINPNTGFDSPSTGCWTPLCYAVYHHYREVVAALVENGANIDKIYPVPHSPHLNVNFSFYGGNNWNALGFCAASQNVKACELLLAHKSESLLDVMLSSLDSGRYCQEVISTLLKAGADPNGGIAPESDDCTPLACAASRNRFAELELLLEYGADPNRGAPKPICKAVQWDGTGDNRLTRLLISKGATFEPFYDHKEPPQFVLSYNHNQWQRNQKILHELRSVQTELFPNTRAKFD